MTRTLPAPTADTESTAVIPADPRRPPGRLRELAAYLAAAVLALAAVWFALDLGHLDWKVPLVYDGDALAVAAHAKTVIETGWYESQSALGAPYGQSYNDFPQADNLHFIWFLLLSAFSHDFGVVLNVYFVIGFPLIAAAAVWFLRLVGVSRVLSAGLAVVFALAPYHFWRGEGHLFLASYYPVPLALGLVYLVATGRPLWRIDPDAPRWRRALTGRSIGTVLTAALVATASSYYSVFTLILLAFAGAAALWQTHSWRRFVGAVAAGLVVIAVMLLNMAPDLIYRIQNGPNPGALVRTPVESEIYAFKLAQLLLPQQDHRFGPFRALRALYDEHYPLPSEGPALGLIAAAGFVGLMVLLVYLIFGVALRGRAYGPLTRKLAVLGAITLVAYLFGSVGALSTLVSFVTTAIRAWNRLSIVIALLSLAAIGLVLDRLIRRVLRDRRPVALLAVPAVALLIGLAVWDQVPPVDAAAAAAREAEFHSDHAYVEAIEAAEPAQAIVYELPYISFPESPPVNGVTDAEQLRPYLHSTDLRWSAGGIRGRSDIEALGALAQLPAADFVSAVEELGVVGVSIDTAAYSDGGAAVIASLGPFSDGPRIDSADGNWVFLPL